MGHFSGSIARVRFSRTPEGIEAFRTHMLNYYKRHKRPMPFRDTEDPYAVLVSEIMLQQTQVERVLPKFKKFYAAFPNPKALAQAPRAEVLAMWQGLGYNRRAIALQDTVKALVEFHQGRIPDDPEVLQKFPGIGPATASSIVAFAYCRPTVFIETNIRRVFIHFFFDDDADVHDDDIRPLLAESLQDVDPRQWYYALMDYGTMLKKHVQNPNRRSKQYRKQSRFEGSDRQLRGEILRRLLAHEELADEEVEAIITDKQRRKSIMQALAKEKFCRQTASGYRIL